MFSLHPSSSTLAPPTTTAPHTPSLVQTCTSPMVACSLPGGGRCQLLICLLPTLFNNRVWDASPQPLPPHASPPINTRADLHFSDGGPLTAQYLLVVDALNFCFWPGERHWGGKAELAITGATDQDAAWVNAY